MKNIDGTHPNIVNMIEYRTEGTEMMQVRDLSESVDTLSNKILDISYSVTEYCPNGSMYDHIAKNGPLPEQVAQFFFKQLVSAVKFLHDQNIAHWDIKPGNIFFDEFFNVKLGDFGWALKLKGKNYGVTKCFGTKSYMAPEVFRASEKAPFSPFWADVYALGATLYFMLTGKTQQLTDTSNSTENDSERESYDYCTSQVYVWNSTLLKQSIWNISTIDTYTGGLENHTALTFSDDLPLILDLIEGSTLKYPNERVKIEDFYGHPWMEAENSEDCWASIFEFMSMEQPNNTTG